MKNFNFLAATLLFSAISQAQAQVIPRISPDTPYQQVRAALIKEGWRPVRQQQEEFDSMANEHKQLGWTEVKSCAGSGLAPCIFIWQNKQGKRLEVVTVGESPKFNAFR